MRFCKKRNEYATVDAHSWPATESNKNTSFEIEGLALFEIISVSHH